MKRSKSLGSSKSKAALTKFAAESNKKKQKKRKSKQAKLEKSNKTAAPPSKKFEAAKTFKINVLKLQSLMAMKKIFGLETDELVDRETASDMKYKTRSMDLTNLLRLLQEDDPTVYHWDMSLGHEPPSEEEAEALLERQQMPFSWWSKTDLNDDALAKRVHWPSDIKTQCQVKTIAGYAANDDESSSLVGDCFYNEADIERFRLDDLFETEPDAFVAVSDDEDYEFVEEIIEEEIMDQEEEEEVEYYEEEIVDTRRSISRRQSL